MCNRGRSLRTAGYSRLGLYFRRMRRPQTLSDDTAICFGTVTSAPSSSVGRVTTDAGHQDAIHES